MTRFGVGGLATIALLAAAAGWYLLANPQVRAKPPSPANPPVPVTVATAVTGDVPDYARGLGTVQAYKTVTVKSRVEGQIVQVSFTEGQEVKAGDPLFQIDPRPFQAALEQAQAARQKDQAQLNGALLDLERYSKLIGSGFQTKQSYDQQKALVEQLQASLKADQAQIDATKLNLAYADIRAPIDGRTGARLVDLGNLVQGAQSAALVSITQVKPIYVAFTLPQDLTDQIRRNQASDGPLAVEAYGSDDHTLLSKGRLTLIDNQVDTATGTIRLKATFDNLDERLWPGEFVNARLILAMRKGVVTVPAPAVMQGPEGPYGYAVRDNGTVERRRLKVAATQEGLAVIAEGFAAGDHVVTDGQYRLYDGARIKIDTAPAS